MHIDTEIWIICYKNINDNLNWRDVYWSNWRTRISMEINPTNKWRNICSFVNFMFRFFSIKNNIILLKYKIFAPHKPIESRICFFVNLPFHSLPRRFDFLQKNFKYQQKIKLNEMIRLKFEQLFVIFVTLTDFRLFWKRTHSIHFIPFGANTMFDLIWTNCRKIDTNKIEKWMTRKNLSLNMFRCII